MIPNHIWLNDGFHSTPSSRSPILVIAFTQKPLARSGKKLTVVVVSWLSELFSRFLSRFTPRFLSKSLARLPSWWPCTWLLSRLLPQFLSRFLSTWSFPRFALARPLSWFSSRFSASSILCQKASLLYWAPPIDELALWIYLAPEDTLKSLTLGKQSVFPSFLYQSDS